MIVYRLTRLSGENSSLVQYDMMEYPWINNDTTPGNDVMNSVSGCIHTATLAVCTVLVIFVLFLGCAGNGVVLFNALTTKKHRHMSELFVINLAGADFITCTCLSPMFLFLLFSDTVIPKVFCASILFLGVTSAMLSLLTLVVIALHRRCRVVGIIRKSLSFSRVSAVVGVIWLISVSLAVAGTVNISLTWKEQSINECRNVIKSGDEQGSNFVLYYLSPVTIASLVLIATCNWTIARAARGQARYGHLTSPQRRDDYSSEAKCEGLVSDNPQFEATTGNKCVSMGRDLSYDNGNKAVIMCFVVTLTVSLCWTPFILSQFVEVFTGESVILYQVKLCGIALIFLNSALNPYLYGQSNSRIKHKYIRVLYNFARCEYSLPGRGSGKVGCDTRVAERWPLNESPATQDTGTGYCCPCCHNCDTCTDSRTDALTDGRASDALYARQYLTNIQYAQNLLLVTAPHGDLRANVV